VSSINKITEFYELENMKFSFSKIQVKLEQSIRHFSKVYPIPNSCKKLFVQFFSYGWIEHVALLRKNCLFNFKKQTFQENFQKSLIFIVIRKGVKLQSYVNILVFFQSAQFRKHIFLVCHTKLTDQKNNCTINFLAGQFCVRN